MPTSSISLVLSYRDPWYGRFRALLESAIQLPGWRVLLLQNTSRSHVRYWQTFWKLLTRKERVGIYLLGFRGLEFYWILRLLVGKQPIIVDALISPAVALREGRSSWLRPLQSVLYTLEKGIYHNAQAILVDTQSHARLFTNTFDLPSEKLFVVPVGAEEKHFLDGGAKDQEHVSDTCTVLYYFSGQALHGGELLEHVLQTAISPRLRFLLVGPQAKHLAADPRVTAIPYVPYPLLPQLIAKADLCLVGPFNDDPQAQRVITAKTFHCLSQGKAVVVGKNLETSKFFTHQKNALVVPLSDPVALAKTLDWAATHPDQIRTLARKGHETYLRLFSSGQRAQQLQKVLQYVQNYS